MDFSSTHRELSLFDAKHYAHHLMKNGPLDVIVNSLCNSTVSKDILDQTELQYALGTHSSDNEHGAQVRNLLFRLFHISEGREDPWKLNEKKTRNSDTDGQKPKVSPVVHSSSNHDMNLKSRLECLKATQQEVKQKTAERKETEVKKTAHKRKLEIQEASPSKSRKIEDQENEPPMEVLIANFFRDLHEDVENGDALMLSPKLEKLPSIPSQKDYGHLLNGLTANVLRKAEKQIGREMNRVDPIWWALVYRDFGRLDRKWSCGVRDIYKGYEAIHAARRQMRCG